LAFKVI